MLNRKMPPEGLGVKSCEFPSAWVFRTTVTLGPEVLAEGP
jgi:hypothetical protein